jgi:hypothetical protein
VPEFAGGLRLEPSVGSIGRFTLDGDLALALTGGLPHAMADAGLGFEFAIARWISLGPVVRYGRVFAQHGEAPIDAQFWSLGLTVSLRSSPQQRPVIVPPAPLDTDHDHIPDDLDRCPRQPPLSHPDPERPGCPDGDIDLDGVPDHWDSCRIEPIGVYEDSVWRGCPAADVDADGVPDGSDACRIEAAGAHPDPARPGCPAPDADHDGLADAHDACPNEVPGAHPDPDRAGCPDGDADRDGVLDHDDACRSVAAGFLADPTRPGCPVPDADGDAVPDALDRCPTVAGAPSRNAATNGCRGPIRVEGNTLVTARPVLFVPHTARVMPGGEAMLRAIVDVSSAAPGMHRISIDVSTDEEPTVSRSEALSLVRGETLRLWLIAHGIEATRLEVHADGRVAAPRTTHPGPIAASGTRVTFRFAAP